MNENLKYELITDSLNKPYIKLKRWKILLNEYDFEIEYIKRKSNQVADFLSRVYVNVRAAIHIGKENMYDHIPISESLINIFKNHIVATLGKKYNYEKLTYTTSKLDI